MKRPVEKNSYISLLDELHEVDHIKKVVGFGVGQYRSRVYSIAITGTPLSSPGMWLCSWSDFWSKMHDCTCQF